MSRDARIYNVLIASPGDLHEVRSLVPPLFTAWNSSGNRQVMLQPVMWEHSSVPEMGANPQDIIDRQLVETSDLLVAIFWTRLGTATSKHISGTIQEIETFIRLKGPQRAMVYFIEKAAQVKPLDQDFEQLQTLRNYREKLQAEGLLCSVADDGEFKFQLYRHLDSKSNALMEGRLPEPGTSSEALSDDDADDKKWPCGKSATDICEAFKKHWATMAARGDKYRDEGARLAATFAKAIDRFISEHQFHLTSSDKTFFREQSHALKQLRLGARGIYYRKAVPRQYWDDGMVIAEQLAVHSQFMKK